MYEQQLNVGMRLNVLSVGNRLLFKGTVQKITGDEIVVKTVSGDDMPEIQHGSFIKLEWFDKRSSDMEVYRARVCGSSERMWMLDDIRPLYKKNRRSAHRVAVNSPGIGMRIQTEGTDADARQNVMKIYIEDISSTGLKFSTNADCEWAIGENVAVEGDIGDVHIRLVCRLIRYELNEERNERIYYGGNFETLSSREEDTLMKAVLKAQSLEIIKSR